MTSYIKIFGIQRTCTTYLKALITLNFKDIIVLVNELGWKHGSIDINLNEWFSSTPDASKRRLAYSAMMSENLCAVIAIKNPYTWYGSIVNWIKREPDDFKVKDVSPKEVFKRYNSLYSEYLTYLNGQEISKIYSKFLLVRYEDLLEYPEPILYNLADKFHFIKNDALILSNKVNNSMEFNSIKKDYYTNQLPNYSRELIDQVTESVDWELMSNYGYLPIQLI